MKSATTILALTLLAGCSGMGMHQQSGAGRGMDQQSASGMQDGGMYTTPMRRGVFAPNYPTANPNDPVNNLYFGG